MVATVCFSALAKHVPVSEAEKVAKNLFLEKCGIDRANLQLDKATVINYNSNDVYYIFNVANNGGYIIVSADDVYNPVIAYSPKGNWDIENCPASVEYLMNTYKKKISYAIANNIEPTAKTKSAWHHYAVAEDLFVPKVGERGVEALTEELTWNQEGGGSEGYTGGWDYFVPEGTPTGCVATAMSIIMYYWKYPIQGKGEHSYYHGPTSETLSANFGETTYMWANMQDKDPTYYSALLQYHAGISVNMKYEPEGSGSHSFRVPNALINFFNYDPACTFKMKNQYTESQWVNYLKTDLDAGRPVYYSGVGPDGGHAFICDGYDDSDNFHFNFGWGGLANGYFALDQVDDFDEDFKMVHNIKPKSANYPYLNTIEEVTAEINLDSETNFEVNISWTAPAKTKSLTGYKIYRGDQEIATVDASTTSYVDNALTEGLSDYYAVRPLYSDGEALSKSAFVKGTYTVNFFVLDASTGIPVKNADVTFNGETKSTVYGLVDFSNVKWGHNYNYTISHPDYDNDLIDVVPIVNEDVTLQVKLGEVGVEDKLESKVSVYPNPATDILFIQGDFKGSTEYSILDITGREIKKGILSNKINTINISEFNAGMYFIKINSLSSTIKFTVD